MKRPAILVFLLLVLCFQAFSQVSKLTYSEDFPEHNGASFIKLLKNGNTLLLQWKEGSYISKIYNTEKKKIIEVTQEVTGLEGSFFMHDVKAVLELNNNEIVIFLVAAPKRKVGRVPVLIRIIIDSQTGKLKKSEQIFEQEPLPSGAGYALAFGGVGAPDFCIKKDPFSNYYALAVLRTFAKEMKDRIQIIHYDPAHTEISNTYLKIPEGFNQIAFRDFVVKGDKYVIMVTEPFVREHHSDGNKIWVSKLTKGSKEFTTKEFKYERVFDEALCTLDQEPQSDNISAVMRILLPSTPKQKNTRMYDVGILPINGEKFELGKLTPVNYEKVSAQYATSVSQTKNPEPYNALVQDYLSDQAGNRIVLSEKTEMITDSQGLSTWPRLSDIGITAVGKDGKEAYGLHIPYIAFVRRNVNSMIYYPYRYSINYGTYTNYTLGPGFVELVAGKKFNYVFLNDTQKNREKTISDKMTVINSFSNLNSYYYKIDNKTGVVTNGFLFGTPEGAETTRICFFDKSAFNAETGEFAAVYLDINPKGKKHSGIVWFKLD